MSAVQGFICGEPHPHESDEPYPHRFEVKVNRVLLDVDMDVPQERMFKALRAAIKVLQEVDA